MLRSLTSGVSGLHHFQQQMDVIGNNIANVNTTAFKSSRVDFAESFQQTLATSGSGDGSAMQIGTGVQTGAIRSLYTQGAIAKTEREADLAIDKEGFFMVRDSVSDELFATRAGNFDITTEGYLTTSGHRLQGFSDTGLATRGDVKIDATGRPNTAAADAVFQSFRIHSDGKIQVTLSDGTTYTRGQVLLQRFQNPQALLREGDNLYSGIAAAGPLGTPENPQSQAPGTNGLGAISSGHIELSNVDLAGEFANLITSQRAFQANARIVTTSDELMQELVSLKR
jgi:flagellar hook protein FlgE